MSEATSTRVDEIRTVFSGFSKEGLRAVRDALHGYEEQRPSHSHGLCNWLAINDHEDGEDLVYYYRVALHGHEDFEPYVTDILGFNEERLEFAIELRDAITEYLRSEAG